MLGLHGGRRRAAVTLRARLGHQDTVWWNKHCRRYLQHCRVRPRSLSRVGRFARLDLNLFAADPDITCPPRSRIAIRARGTQYPVASRTRAFSQPILSAILADSATLTWIR